MNDIYYMKEAIKEAKKCFLSEDIPVGCVIVDNKSGKIVARGHNTRNKNNVVTQHAEILAIQKANKRYNDWRLINCTLYSTLEPCEMCLEVIKCCRIRNVIYCGKRNLECKKFVELTQIDDDMLINESLTLIKKQFKNIRK